jgi:hypothetical protein
MKYVVSISTCAPFDNIGPTLCDGLISDHGSCIVLHFQSNMKCIEGNKPFILDIVPVVNV